MAQRPVSPQCPHAAQGCRAVEVPGAQVKLFHPEKRQSGWTEGGAASRGQLNTGLPQPSTQLPAFSSVASASVALPCPQTLLVWNSQ